MLNIALSSRRFSRVVYSLVAVAVVSASLSACGSSDGGSDKPGTSSELPAKISSAGHIVIAVNAPYPPFENLIDDKLVGVDIELGEAIAKGLGSKAKFVNVPFDAIVPGMAGSRFDMAISAFDDTPEYQKVVDFVDYFSQSVSLLKQKGNPSGVALGEMCGKKIAAQKSTTSSDNFLPEASKKCERAGKKPIQIQTYTDQAAVLLAVTSGRADASLQLSATSSYIASQQPKLESAPEATDGPSFISPIILAGVMLPKEDGIDPKAVQKVLEELKADGTYDAILKKWNVGEGSLEKFTINGGK